MKKIELKTDEELRHLANCLKILGDYLLTQPKEEFIAPKDDEQKGA